MTVTDAPARTILGIEVDAKNLPLIIARAIRRGEYQPAEKQALLELANLVRGHSRFDYNVGNLETLLAAAVVAQPFPESHPETPLTKIESDIREMSHHMLAVPRAWNNPLLHHVGGETQTASLLLTRANAQVAEDRRARYLSQGGLDEAFITIREMVADAADRYPEFGLSFGYIGGVHTWGDDRSYKVFAKLATHDCHGACNISFGGYSHNRIGDLLIAMEKRFAGWLETTQARLDAGEIRRVGA